VVDQQAPPAFPRAELPGVGTVSLATLGELRDAQRTERARVDRMAWQVAELGGQAEDCLAAAGAVLVPRRAWWPVPPELSSHLARAEQLASRIALLDRRLGGPGPPPGGSTPGSGLLGWAGGRRAQRSRERAAAQLRQSLVVIAGAAAGAGAGVPDVGPLLERAEQLRAWTESLRQTLTGAAGRLAALEHEIRLREEAERRMGFDSLHLAGYFRLHGLPAIERPMTLEAGEVAHLAVPATLVRTPSGLRRGGGSGNVPIAYTGINPWVGVLRPSRAPRPAVEQADAGTLVVTSRRLAFVGAAQPLAVPLASVVDVDVYEDGIAVLSLGRESPDLLLVTAPRQVVFYFNWALASEMAY
jgi:hypothetical protein